MNGCRQLLHVLVAIFVISTIPVRHLAATESSAATPKAPWEWTTDERLAGRVALLTPGAQGRIKAAETSEPIGYAIDGRRNPELFLAHELFDALLTGLMPDDALRARQRGFYETALERLGYQDDAFWSSLASVSSEYLAFRFGGKAGTADETRQWVLDRCRARYEALEGARRVFGRRQFDRLLYTTVASTMQYAAAGGTAPAAVDALRQAEEGCR